MIRTAVPRPVRVGAALVGVAGMMTLAGCAGTSTDTGAGASDPVDSPAAEAPGTGGDSAASGAYADGTYTAEGSYRTPESTETIQVTITLQDDVITAVDVTGDPQAAQSQQYQSRFIGGIADEVVGQDIDAISVDRVAGSSLTSGGFNEAIDTIRSEAAA
jgi:uncharacterized protein with FMN-binding domain